MIGAQGIGIGAGVGVALTLHPASLPSNVESKAVALFQKGQLAAHPRGGETGEAKAARK